MIRPAFIRAVLAAGACALVGACALLSSPDPVQLYRFGGDPAESRGAAIGSPVQVSLRPIEFAQASRGDRFLGITGSEAAYIEGARWVAPAETMYGESIENAFAIEAQRVRLLGRRELTPATRALDLDVRAFETRYTAPGAIPTVVVTVQARLLRQPERTIVGERTFTVAQPATENRVSAIVAAFDVATRDVNSQIVTWTDSLAG